MSQNRNEIIEKLLFTIFFLTCLSKRAGDRHWWHIVLWRGPRPDSDGKYWGYMPHMLDLPFIYNSHAVMKLHRIMDYFWPMKTWNPAHKGRCALSVWVESEKCQISKCQSDHGRLAPSKRHVIPTVLDRSSDICVHEQARLCSVLFWCGLWGFHEEEEEQTPSELISVTLHSTDTMSHASKCDCWCGFRGISHHQARAL